MICEACVERADDADKPGCAESCGIHGCSCQHKARRAEKKDEPTGDPTDC